MQKVKASHGHGAFMAGIDWALSPRYQSGNARVNTAFVQAPEALSRWRGGDLGWGAGTAEEEVEKRALSE